MTFPAPMNIAMRIILLAAMLAVLSACASDKTTVQAGGYVRTDVRR